jgi:chromosome segregation ATPase
METPDDNAPAAEAPVLDDDAPLSADPVTEIRTLRAKNRILRAERTAIAGRKYVLETVVESLRQKLEELARAFAALQGGGDIAEAIRTVGALVRDAQRIAEDKESLEGELDAERLDRLTERRTREAREFELEERAAGLAAERSVLSERVEVLEHKVAELQETHDDVEDLRRQLGTATAELATAATELERAANEAEARSRELADARHAHERAVKERDELNAELEATRVSTESVARVKDERQGEVEQLQIDLEHARSERDGLNRSLIAAQAEHARALEQTLEEGARTVENDRRLREELAATLEEERARMRKALDDAAARQSLEAEKERLAAAAKEAGELRAKLAEQQPVLDALADKVDELEKELTRLETRLGEYRDRGKVDVRELLIRAAVLKRRAEREALEQAQRPITRAATRPSAGVPRATGTLPKPGPSSGSALRAGPPKAPARVNEADPGA